jgi:hypothetical protein
VGAPKAHGVKVAPAAREASVAPAAREASVAPASREASVAPAAREASVAPEAREASVALGGVEPPRPSRPVTWSRGARAVLGRGIHLPLTLARHTARSQMAGEARMNLYHCMIDLKDDAKALAFAQALDHWMEHLKSRGAIRGWRLLRRKLNLASDAHKDFLLEVEVDDLAQLDRAFRILGTEGDDNVERLHRQVHQLVAATGFALYRPFPDPERAERMGLI